MGLVNLREGLSIEWSPVYAIKFDKDTDLATMTTVIFADTPKPDPPGRPDPEPDTVQPIVIETEQRQPRPVYQAVHAQLRSHKNWIVHDLAAIDGSKVIRIHVPKDGAEATIWFSLKIRNATVSFKVKNFVGEYFETEAGRRQALPASSGRS